MGIIKAFFGIIWATLEYAAAYLLLILVTFIFGWVTGHFG